MVAFNVSLDDSSPLINYAGSWIDTPANDVFAANYSGNSFHASNSSGSTLSFKFNGTGVWLYGSHRPGYGTYSISMDGRPFVENATAAAAVPTFDLLMGGVRNMTMGEHTLVLTSNGGGSVNFDSLVFETQVASDGQELNVTALDDGNAEILYSPSSAWEVADNSFFANGSAHYTQTADAQATLSFNGDAVAVYGGVSFDHGPYTVSVDGQSQQLNGGSAREYHPQSLLYFSQGLGSGEHKLTITADSGFLDLDAILVYSATGTGDTSASSSTTSLASTFTVSASASSPTSSTMSSNGTNTFHVDQSGQPGNANGDGASMGNNVMGGSSMGSNAMDNNANGVDAATTNTIPKTVLAGIIVASIIGAISVLLIIIFIVQQARKRRRMEAAARAADSPILPIQTPDLESGLGGKVADEKAQGDLQRGNSKYTIKSLASRWSQASFVSGPAHDLEAPPPVPPMPTTVPTLGIPIPRSERTASAFSNSTRDSRSEADPYYFRQSTGTDSVTSSASVAPQRPPRPPGLDLGDLGLEFGNVPL